MTKPKFAAAVLLVLPIISISTGSWGASSGGYAPDVAIVVDGVLSAPRNFPPVENAEVFSLVDIDGQAIKREQPPPLVDMYPGAIIGPGKHTFRVHVAPALRPPSYKPRDVTFTATVEAGKRYFVVSKEGLPGLLEIRRDPNKAQESTPNEAH